MSVFPTAVRLIRTGLLLVLLLAPRPAHAAEATIAVHELRHATWTSNPANYARRTLEGGTLRLSVGIGDARGSVTAQLADMGFGAAGARLSVPPALEFSITQRGTPRAVDDNALAALIVDYHTPSGYLRRGAVPLGLPLGTKRSDTLPFWGRGSVPELELKPEALGGGRYRLDLQPTAPLGWDGQIWLTALVENTAHGTELSVELHGVEAKLETTSASSAAALPVEPIAWQTVGLTGRTLLCGKLDEAEGLALQKLLARAPLTMTTAPLASAAGGKAQGPLLVVARPGELAQLASLLGADAAAEFTGLLADDKAWRTEQGYVLKYDATRDVLLAVAGGRAGMIYALSHLQRSLVLEPAAGIALEAPLSVEKPKLEERGIYVNIGYGLSMGPITVDNWSDAEWEAFIDRLILSRVTFWTFFFWGDCEHIYPDTSGAYHEKNKRVFEQVRRAIAYSQRRGLRAVYLSTPSMIPSDMLERHPDWRNTLEFDSPGTICTRQPDAWEAAKLVHRQGIEYFRGVDEFDINFYDPGGCMCTECRKGDVQLEQLVKEVRDTLAVTSQTNPRARFGFWTWAVWRYERLQGYSLQGKLLPRIAELFKGQTSRVVVIDSLKGDLGAVPYFDEAKALGFRTSNFIYQTNIEDGWGLLLPLLDFTRQYAGEAQHKQLDESFLMIMEVNSKYPMAHFGADYFWDASLTKDRVAGRYALQLTGSVAAARPLQQAFVELDRLTYNGASGVDNFAALATRVREQFEQGVAATPAARRPEVAWLEATGRAYALLFEAVALRHEDKPQEYAQHKEALREMLSNDPLFQAFGATYVPKFFDQFVSWLDNGYKNGHF